MLDEAALNEAVSQIANALQAAYGLAMTLRKQLADAEQNALAMEQSMWTCVSALRRLQGKNGGGK
jgi:hypothetical protein